MTTSPASEPQYSGVDLAGIGFGPSNLAVAIAADEAARSGAAPRPLTHAYFERQPVFGWHRGMLIEGATMQVSFLKDLVTLRNPASEYSFVAYLHAKNRLPDFINNHTMFPSRTEFHDYLEWAALPFAGRVRYGVEVTQIKPVVDAGVVTHLDIVGREAGRPDRQVVQRAANLVIGTGITPHLPDGVVTSNRVWHSARLMDAVADLAASNPRRIFVVGAGQSAAEAADCLLRRCPTAEVCTVYSRFGYGVADDSAFANRIFDPESVDLLYGAPEDIRRQMLAYHANTNYSVVDLELCQSLYRTQYEERVAGGTSRLRIMNASTVRAVEEGADGVRVDVESLLTGRVEALSADAVVYATGYRPSDPAPLLDAIAAECKHDGDGRLVLDRDYRVITSDAVACAIYLQGAVAEPSHGISAGLLSTTAVRSGEIVRSVLRRIR